MSATPDVEQRTRFESLYSKYLEHCRRPEVQLSSSSKARLNCVAIEEIKREGWKYVPFVIEKIEAGDFHIAYALPDMTGEGLHEAFFTNAPSEAGAQDYAAHCVRWWLDEGQRTYSKLMENNQASENHVIP